MHIGLVNAGHFSTHSRTYNTWYMPLTQDEVLCLKLNSEGTQFTIHALTHAYELLCLQCNHCGLFIFTLPRFSFGSPLSLPANTAQHNIPQHFPSSVCNCMKDADTIASIVHTFQTSPDVTVQ